MSEKVRQARNRAHSAEQTPGETKQGRYGGSWQELESGLLVPGLGVVATMAGDGKIIVTDRRGRANRYQSAEAPNLNDGSLQHDEGGSRNLIEEEQQPQNPEQLDDSEWFTPPGDVEFSTSEFGLIEQGLKDAIEWGDDLLLTRLNADWLSPLLKALCWQLDQHAYILDDERQTSLLRDAIDSCLNEGSDRAIKLSEITDKITETDLIAGCDDDAVYREMLRPQWRIDSECDERLRDKVEERIKDVQALLGDEPPTSSEIVAYAGQFEQIHGFVPSCFTLYNWLSQHPDVGEKHATEQ